MKKFVGLFLLFLICLNIKSSFAITGTLLSEDDYNYISHNKEIDELFKIAEEDLNNEIAIKALGELRFKIKESMRRRYDNDDVHPEELRNLLKNLIATTNNPQTAKDYFYKALFSRFLKSQGSFKYVIDNFPDSPYAEYSYIFWSGDSFGDNEVSILEGYLEKYSDSILVPNVYYLLSNAYGNLKIKDISKLSSEEKKRIDHILKYSNKILDEYPERKRLVGRKLLELGYHYGYYLKNQKKALEYYYKVFSNFEFGRRAINESIENIVRLFKREKEYEKINAFLEDIKKRYYTDRYLRHRYKMYKRNLEEILLFRYDDTDVTQVNRKLFEAKKDEILKFREEWEKKFEKDWPPSEEEKKDNKRLEAEKIAREKRAEEIEKLGLRDKASLNLSIYEKPTNYYSKVSREDNYFYNDVLQIKIKVVLKNNDLNKELYIRQNDWHNMLKLNVGTAHEYSLPRKYSEAHKTKTKIINTYDIGDGKLKPEEEKIALIEIFNIDNLPFKAGFYYKSRVWIPVKIDKYLLNFGDKIEYLIIKPVTPDQIKDWTIRKGDRAVKEIKYKEAIKHYQEVLEKETENQSIRKILYRKLADTYELDKDYANAKKWLVELLKHVEDEIKVAKDKTKLEEEKAKLEEEKARIEKKMQEIEGL